MKVLVVGSGTAGLSSAIEAASRGLDVVLVSPLVSERSQSIMAMGGINAAVGEDDSPAIHAKDTIRGGAFIENETDIRAFCEAAPENMKWLEDMGMTFSREKDGKRKVRAFGAQSRKRTAFAGAHTGVQLITALAAKCREYEIKNKIERITRMWFHSALIKEGICYGALFMDEVTGRLVTIYADAVIMATGGMNVLFGKTTGSWLCDGYAAGRLFTQGAKLKNLEFIQYHATTIETDHKNILISEAVRGEGGRLFYYEGEKKVYFMEEKFGPEGNLMARDIVAKCMYDSGKQVYLDAACIGKEVIIDRLEEVYNTCKKYLNIDITKEPIPVQPAVHFFMGGLYVDRNHRTNIARLYAVGECASKYHGANRLGANSTMTAIYSGRVAARDIVERLTEISGDTTAFDGYIEEEQEKLYELLNSQSRFPKIYLLNSLFKTMNKSLGIVRNETEIKEGLKGIEYIIKAEKNIKCAADISLYENIRAGYMLILAKAMLMSALERKESRGAHIRADYPESDPEYRKASIAEYNGGDIRISFIKESEEEEGTRL